MSDTPSIEQRMRTILDETVAFYGADPKRRAENHHRGTCQFETEDGRHCAVGRYMTPEEVTIVRRFGINGGTVGQLRAWDCLPGALRGIPLEFMVDLQSLHDGSHNWTVSGISGYGIELVQTITSRIDTGKYSS